MEDILSITTFFEWLRDLKEFIKNQPSTSTEISNVTISNQINQIVDHGTSIPQTVDRGIFIPTSSKLTDNNVNIDTLFTTTSKQKTDGIVQYITKLDNSRLHTVKTPEGEIGHQLIRLDVYDFNDVKNKDKRFIIEKQFVVKEVAILKNGNILTHYIFKSPMPWRFLTTSDKRCATWLMINHHGLQWNDGMVPYCMARQLISEAVKGNSSAIVFVKGLEKRKWLNDIINNDYIVNKSIDTHHENIKSLENLDSNNTFRCGRHVKHCALQNVLKLFNW
ncbi:hypothetical protein ALC57_05117 [Trachymyrmex cornetzi]|uniref:Uncharacterized protein n=1 Tax=Trachymyrmex cornetzi TaxID=471704 RepID=A0A151JBE7_9HYME|nr:hypothetical protein ALC57_05117 [Trachymyrmex cornetzi]